jgi:hypothetical protein
MAFVSIAGADTIQDGTILYSSTHYLAEQPLKTGYDIFGYNYQARLFNGSYANVYLGKDGFPPYPYEGTDEDKANYQTDNPGVDSKWYWPYRDIYLVMKWNDAWLSNKDQDGDGELDRHYGYFSYIGSGAWETNRMYELDGETVVWDSFTKIIAAPADAYLDSGYWYTADGMEIGPEIWGQFAITQDIYNEPGSGTEGPTYISPAGPGFGKW